MQKMLQRMASSAPGHTTWCVDSESTVTVSPYPQSTHGPGAGGTGGAGGWGGGARTRRGGTLTHERLGLRPTTSATQTAAQCFRQKHHMPTAMEWAQRFTSHSKRQPAYKKPRRVVNSSLFCLQQSKEWPHTWPLGNSRPTGENQLLAVDTYSRLLCALHPAALCPPPSTLLLCALHPPP